MADFEGAIGGKTPQDGAFISLFEHLAGQASAEIDPTARLDTAGVLDEAPPDIRGFALVQGHADAGVSDAAMELRRDDAGIIDDQHIAGAQP